MTKKLNNRQIVGIIIESLNGIILFSLFTNAFILGIVGSTISEFFKGLFGLSAYPIFICIAFVSAMMIADKKLNISLKFLINFFVLFFIVICLVHTMTSQSIVLSGNTFSEYIEQCFNFSKLATFGGAFAALFIFPLCNTIDLVGTYILLCGLLAICLYISTLYFAQRSSGIMSRFFNQPVTENKKLFIANSQSPIQNPTQTSEAIRQLYPNENITPTQNTNSKDALFGNANSKRNDENINDSLNSNSYLTAHQSNIKPSERPVDTLFVSQLDNNAKRPPKILHGNDEFIVKPLYDNVEKEPEVAVIPSIDPAKAKSLDDYRALKGDKSKARDGLAPIINGDEAAARLREKKLLEEQEKQKLIKPINVVEDKKIISSTVSTDIFEDDNDVFIPDIKNENDIVNISEFNDDSFMKSSRRFEENEVVDVTIVDEVPETIVEVKPQLIKQVSPINPAPMDTFSKPIDYVPYKAPPLDLLDDMVFDVSIIGKDTEESAKLLESALNEFKIDAEVVNTVVGPTVTRYELEMAPGISVKKVSNIADDIAMRLASNGGVRIEAPIPGKNLFGVEVPNKIRATVTLRSVLESVDFANASSSSLRFGLGIDIGGQRIVPDLADMPHLLIAGSTGTGKSVCMNALLISLMFKYSPDDLRFILVDPKHVEFTIYREMPHLLVKDVLTQPEQAISAFDWLIGEMERRYMLFNAMSKTNIVRDINSYNKAIDTNMIQKLPRIILVVDELSDLMTFNKQEIDGKILRLAAKARAAGIHLVLATQRPSVNIITGTVKANLPCRIALKTIAGADSRTILDQGGPEKLIGMGDMLYQSARMPEAIRVQGAYLSNDEIDRVIKYIKFNNENRYDETISKAILKPKTSSEVKTNNDDCDPIFFDALKYIVETGQASISMLQRRFSVGYNRAGKLIEDMERRHYISGFDGSKTRQVLITMEEYDKLFGEEING